MSNSLLKTKKIFQRNISTNVYFRTKEIEHVKDFLSSDTNILHICGNPGTGKTCTVLFVLKNKRFEYFNFLEDQSTIKKVLCSKFNVIVIDEFDKLYKESKKECLKLFDRIEREDKKLITISNGCNFVDSVYVFDAYTSAEINEILKAKISDELGLQIIDDKLLNFISKKYGSLGDIRKVFDYIKNLIDKRDYVKDTGQLKIEDAIDCNVKKDEEGNLHEQIVKSIVNNKKSITKNEVYKLYYNECTIANVQPLNRNDVFLLFDLHQ